MIMDPPTTARVPHTAIILTGAVQGLLKEATLAGRWGDIRTTADALLALSHCLGPAAYPRMRTEAASWLIRRSSPGESGKTWNEEVWDTSVAVMALCGQPEKHTDSIRAGLMWLAVRYQNDRQNWNDEPWETCWALLAFYTAREHGILLEAENQIDLAAPLRWLLSLIGTPSRGILVNWHYSGLFLLVSRRFLTSSGVADPSVSGGFRARVHDARSEVIAALKKEVQKGQPWTNELWSSSLVLWGLAESEALDEETAGIAGLLPWFDQQLRGCPFTEDRSFACIALLHLLLSFKVHSDKWLAEACRSARDRHSQDEDVLKILDRYQSTVGNTQISGIRHELLRSIRGTGLPDMPPKPPLMDRRAYRGFYTFNVSTKIANVCLIFVTTGLLFLTSKEAEFVQSSNFKFLSFLPLVVGAMATIAQLTNFTVGDLRLKKAADKDDDQDD